MREPRKPIRLSEISRSSRCRVDPWLSGRVKILRRVSRVAWAFFPGGGARSDTSGAPGVRLAGQVGGPDLFQRARVELGRDLVDAIDQRDRLRQLEVRAPTA